MFNSFSYIGIQVGFPTTEFDLLEGDTVIATIRGFQGLSFGSIPVAVTPLACSDYAGDLTELFTNIPATSADPCKMAVILFVCMDTFMHGY